ncbi:alpha-L-fucosidase [Kitasatospora sp. NPDC059327]|uniref:alpha-L-fucosidase n=1 Tax=Kitasatospora sp. NPDC059327 TaxID=3346803 RepID=UPI00367EAE13
MPLSRRAFLTAAGAVAAASGSGLLPVPAARAAGSGPYEPTWPSVNRHTPAPEWFKDAKFGVYFHWGAFSVPAYDNEWYPRNMYQPGSGPNQHHHATFGTPAAWPYHTFIDGGRDKAGTFHQFAPRLVSRGGRFDPEEWARLFKAAGARFAGPVAEHHDGYSMWDSRVNEWNSAARGPKLDLLRLFTDAIRGQDMKLLVAMHHAYNFTGYYQYTPTQSDPGLKKLYGQLDRTAANQLWYDKLKEVVDRARPDILWQDFNLDEVDERKRLEFHAYYYNQAETWGKEVVSTHKEQYPSPGEVYDFERGGPGDLREPYWLTDDSVSSSSWCHTTGIGYYSTPQMIHALLDRVSKGGNMLLNIAPTADGTIPQEQRDILLGIGDHLTRFGEAVYDTRPWTAYGEGPTAMGGGAFTEPVAGTAKDIRFTRNKAGTVLFATALGWPSDGLTVTTCSRKRVDLTTLTGVRLLGPGAGESVEISGWAQDADGLRVPLPAAAPFAAEAYTLRLTFTAAIPPLTPPTRITAFRDIDFHGPRATLPLGDHTAARLRTAGLGPASISSLHIPTAYRVVGYPGDHFTGTPWTFTTDTADLRTAGANDRIRSLRVTLAPEPWLRIANAATGLVIDGGGDVPAGSVVKQWTAGSSTNLQWHAIELGTGRYRLVNRTNGLVIDATGTAAAGTVRQRGWDGGDGQQWTITDAGAGACTIANHGSGLLLSGAGARTDGAPLKLAVPGTDPASHWTLRAVA